MGNRSQPGGDNHQENNRSRESYNFIRDIAHQLYRPEAKQNQSVNQIDTTSVGFASIERELLQNPNIFILEIQKNPAKITALAQNIEKIYGTENKPLDQSENAYLNHLHQMGGDDPAYFQGRTKALMGVQSALKQMEDSGYSSQAFHAAQKIVQQAIIAPVKTCWNLANLYGDKGGPNDPGYKKYESMANILQGIIDKSR